MASKSSKRENLIKMAEEWSISVKELAENMLKIENNQRLVLIGFCIELCCAF